MRSASTFLVPVLLPAAVVAVGLLVAPSAAADCLSSSGTTICSQGSVRGSDTGQGPGTMSGPVVPYPCEYDWYCDDWDLDVILDPGPGRPGGPDIGRPGRPGIGPR